MLGKLLSIGLLSLLVPFSALADVEEDIEGYLELDRRLRKLAYERKWEDAIRLCDQAVSKEPNFFGGYDLRAWARLGELEQGHGSDFGQDKALREQLRRQLDSIIADSNKAVQLSEAFEKQFNSGSVSSTPELSYIEAKIYATRARARYHAHDFNGAFADYLKANKLDLSSAEYACGIGRARAGKNDLSNALLDFELARAIDATYVPTYLGRARVQMGLGKSTEAITDFSRGIALIETHEIDDPLDIAPEQLASLSEIYGERAAAKRAARDTTSADQDLSWQRAMLDEKDQRWEKARDEYSQLIKAGKTSEDQARAFSGRSRAESRLGRLDLALRDAGSAIELHAAPLSYSARAGIHRQNGDAARAIEDYTKALGLLTKQRGRAYGVGLVSRAEAYRENKQLDLALADLKAARDQNLGYRQNARKHGLHGLVLTELGQENEAADSLRYSRANDEQFFEEKIEPELDKILQKRNLPSDPKAANLAWELGAALGKAAFLSAQQAGSDKAKTAFAGAAQYAKSLKVTVLPLPPNGQSKEEDLRHAVEYLKQAGTRSHRKSIKPTAGRRQCASIWQ